MWGKEEIQVAEWNQPYLVDIAEFPMFNLCEDFPQFFWDEKHREHIKNSNSAV